jgi:hypothetical protein
VQSWEEALLEILGREAIERRTDRLRGEEVERDREPVVAEDLLSERRVEVRQPASSELLRPWKPDPALASERFGHRTRVAVGEEALASPLGIRLEQRSQALAEGAGLIAKRQLLLGQPEVHAGRS